MRDNCILNNCKTVLAAAAVCLFIVSAAGCGKKAGSVAPEQSSSQAGLKKRAMPVYTQPKPAPKYEYHGSIYRDPLIPVSAAASHSTFEASGPVEEFMDRDKIVTLILQGIMRDRNGSGIALIVDNAGNSYTLKDGKLYNKRYRAVRGVTGSIERSRVMLYSQGSRVELRLKKSTGDK
jgi:hypothetical protein